MNKPKFSVVVIMKNEAKTLPRLVGSLKEFMDRGGEFICLDTGSTDGTAEVARGLGCKVTEVGEKFITTITELQAKAINDRFIVEGEAPVLKAGNRLFDYTAARNFAASLSSNNFCAMPDCDEIYTKIDLDLLNKRIDEGAERFEYNFVFAHDAFGAEIIKFMHSKFYDRTKFRWVGIVHEVLAGEGKSIFIPETHLKLEHWQNPDTNRGNYMPGLALDCYLNPDNDRNSHYFARELMWHGRNKSALKEFKRHIEMNRWPAEAAQSMIFCGDCHMNIGQEKEALNWWHAAYLKDGSRRESLLRLARFFWVRNDPQHTAAYTAAALTIPWNNFYCNNMAHYTNEPHEFMYWALWHLGDHEGSKEHWKKAIEFQPGNAKYQQDAWFYYTLPKVSIVIPTLGRQEQLQRLLKLIQDRAHYANLEIIIEEDSFTDRQGCPKTLKKGVERSTGDLVMFLGNDCIPQDGFVLSAVVSLLRKWGDGIGMVGLNDGFWKKGEVATHWLASKKLLPLLDGEFFHTGYHHVGCDNELTERCRNLGRYIWDEHAKIEHSTPAQGNGKEVDEVYKLAWDPQAIEEDRRLLQERAKRFGFRVT